MHAHRTTVTVDAGHEVVLRLPPDFPAGEAEVIVIAEQGRGQRPVAERLQRLKALLDSVPPAPDLPLSAFDRDEIYR